MRIPARHPLLCSVALLLVVTTRAASEQPNLVIALGDDLSAVELDILASGHPSRNEPVTPTFNKMRNRGVSFTTAWSMPICGPTRGSIVTGLYAQLTGWFTNAGKPKGISLGEEFGSFATLAKEQGYHTLVAGKWQMQGSVSSYGFDEACLWQTSDDPTKRKRDYFDTFTGQYHKGQPSRYWHPFFITNGSLIPTEELDFGPNIVFGCAMDFISRQTALGNKYLVYLPLILTHRAYDFDIEKDEVYLPVPIVSKSGKIIGKEEGPGSFKRNIEYLDYLMGRLLKHIKKERQDQNTITFFMGDNGSANYGKQKDDNELANRVPFLVYGPGQVKRRRDSKVMVSTNDIYSTVRGFIGGSEPPGYPRPHSVDMAPYLLGSDKEKTRAWLYAYLGDKRWIRNKRYVYDGNKVLWDCPSIDERNCTVIRPSQLTGKRRMLVEDFKTIICLLDANETVNPTELKQKFEDPIRSAMYRSCP